MRIDYFTRSEIIYNNATRSRTKTKVKAATTTTLHSCSTMQKFNNNITVFWLIYLTIFFCRSNVIVRASHVSSDSFPSNDEYDFVLLDPNSLFGSPYGGYSRATRSRLASLPLKLPNIDEEVENFDPWYEEIRDAEGRLFICRIYHQDELEEENNPSSLYESMFDLVRSVPTASSNSKINQSKESRKYKSTTAKGTDQPSSKVTHGSNIAAGSAKSNNLSGNERDQNKYNNVVDNPTSNKYNDNDLREMNIELLLSELEGICAQIHLGWWSYQWCYMANIVQFHVDDEDVPSKPTTIKSTDQTSLGEYSDRYYLFPPNKKEEKSDLKSYEIGRVLDYYEDGDTCPETGKTRSSLVTLKCCPENIKSDKSGHRSAATRPDLVSIESIIEEPDTVCVYNITICTSILCLEPENTHKLPKQRSPTKTSTGKGTTSHQKLDNPPKASKEREPFSVDLTAIRDMSIQDVLDATFGHGRQACIIHITAGWWSYEFCYNKYIKQFHQTAGINPRTGIHSWVVETEHDLGLYDKTTPRYSKQEEWKYIINATSPIVPKKGADGITKAGKEYGNGAKFVHEYIEGDPCTHEDVTNAAIKAGEVGSGIIERSSTVAYSCGPELDIRVREDSTCHYVVDVTVPALCHHALFQSPVSKRQVVKCLPSW